jgi:hypothetical protein
MSRLKSLNTGDEQGLARQVKQLRTELQKAEPDILANLTGSRYLSEGTKRGKFLLPVWGHTTVLTYPEYIAFDEITGEQAPIPTQALLAYYFHTADGTTLASRWISFSELPDGRFYNQAFQANTGQELERAFGDNIQRFFRAANTLPKAKLPAGSESIGDHSFPIAPLPRVPLLAVCWQGDEDFNSSYQLLFDASVVHYLPTDVCAILGSMLTRKLIAQTHTPEETT